MTLDADIKQKIRDILNEHGGADSLTISADRVLLDDYITVAIKDAVALLSKNGYRVNTVSLGQEDHEGEGVYSLPQGFLSLVEAKFTNWVRPVTRITEKKEPAFAWAMNEYTPPGVNTPICFRQNGFLHCLPVGEYEHIEINIAYDGIQLHAEERETAAVAYMAAALVMGYFEDDNGKQRLSNIATEYLQ